MFPVLLTGVLAAQHAAACLSTNWFYTIEGVLETQQNFLPLFQAFLPRTKVEFSCYLFFSFWFFFPSLSSQEIVAMLQDCSFFGELSSVIAVLIWCDQGMLRWSQERSKSSWKGARQVEAAKARRRWLWRTDCSKGTISIFKLSLSAPF